MADQGNTGEKTEKATPKKLRDARKRGEVAKSKDLTASLGFAFAVVLLWSAAGWGTDRLVALFDQTLRFGDVPFLDALRRHGRDAAELFVLLSAAALVPIAAVGMLVEFLQAGPVLAFEKVKPQLSNLDPVAGIKKMFGADNLVELVKSVAKTATLFFVLWHVVSTLVGTLVWLPAAEPGHAIAVLGGALARLVGWTLGIFLLFTAFDAAWQRYSFGKKQRMSVSDVKKEFKDSEGDPMIKGQRRRMHEEWSQEGPAEAAREATVLVVNPTHVAVALRYDAEEEPVPLVTAVGEHEVAQAMRDAANEAHVPVLRNELLARTLLRDAEPGDYVPRELFDIVAEVVLWARRASDSMLSPVERERRAELARRDGAAGAGDASEEDDPPRVPGEDLTDYPRDGFGRAVGGGVRTDGAAEGGVAGDGVAGGEGAADDGPDGGPDGGPGDRGARAAPRRRRDRGPPPEPEPFGRP